MIDVVTNQLADVQRRYPTARTEQTADGQRVLVVPGIQLEAGWSSPDTTLRFVVPVGYPHANLDSFYTDASLRLASGAEPDNTALQQMFGGQYRWFSWHLGSGWDVERGSLDTYVRFCERRLRDVR